MSRTMERGRRHSNLRRALQLLEEQSAILSALQEFVAAREQVVISLFQLFVYLS